MNYWIDIHELTYVQSNCLILAGYINGIVATGNVWTILQWRNRDRKLFACMCVNKKMAVFLWWCWGNYWIWWKGRWELNLSLWKWKIVLFFGRQYFVVNKTLKSFRGDKLMKNKTQIYYSSSFAFIWRIIGKSFTSLQ